MKVKNNIATNSIHTTTVVRATRWHLRSLIPSLAPSCVCVLVLSLPALSRAESPSLDDLLDLNPAPTNPANPDNANQASPDKPAPTDATVPDKIIPPPEAGGSPEQIFDRALARMREASDRMGDKRDVGLQTQRLQTSALTLMDQVIAEAAKRQQQQQQQSDDQSQQQQQQQNGSSENASQSQQQATGPSQPSGSSTPSDGNTSRGTPTNANAGEPLEELQSQWGNLPPRLRDQLLQGMNERFSPIYQQLTEAYYRRLAEESSQ